MSEFMKQVLRDSARDAGTGLLAGARDQLANGSVRQEVQSPQYWLGPTEIALGFELTALALAADSPFWYGVGSGLTQHGASHLGRTAVQDLQKRFARAATVGSGSGAGSAAHQQEVVTPATLSTPTPLGMDDDYPFVEKY